MTLQFKIDLLRPRIIKRISKLKPQLLEPFGSQWALSFNGVDNDVRTANALPIGSGDFSVSWRFKSNYSAVGANDVMLCNRDTVGSVFPITMYLFQKSSNQKLECRIFDAIGTPFAVESLAIINDNIEHHAFFYREESTIYLYLDGVFQASISGIVGDFSNSHVLQIGRAVFWGTQAAFKGYISNVYICNRAPEGLGEIIKLFENPQARPDTLDLVSELQFQEGSGIADNTQLRDRSGNNNHVFMQNFSSDPWVNVGVR